MLDEQQTTPNPTLYTTARPGFFPGPFYRYWPFHRIHPEIPNPLAPMLKTLVHAAETTLETNIRSAMVSAHSLEDLGTASAHVQNTLGAMGIESWYGPRRTIRHLMSALQLEGPCNDPEDLENDISRPQHILAIEYTRQSMAAVMWGEECGDYWRLSRVSSCEYGHNAVTACRNDNGDVEQCNAKLQAAFRKLVRTATNRAESPALGVVLLFGENADDENFASVLRKALDDNFSNGASISPVNMQDFSPDLAFAGSRAMVMFELRHKKWQRELAEEGRNEHGEL
jgi:hypothetical protein